MYLSHTNSYGDSNTDVDLDPDSYTYVDFDSNVDPNVDCHGNSDSNGNTDVDRNPDTDQYTYAGVGYVLLGVFSVRWYHLLVRQERKWTIQPYVGGG